MQILFEDDDIVVCIKPVGVLSQADQSGNESMITALSEITNTTVYPLHRLDKQVGGVMVYAKNATAAAVLSRDIAEHNFKKEYIAVVHGTPDECGEMCDMLFKDSRKNKSFVVNRQRKGVKMAKLEYWLLKSQGGTSAVRVLLHTGRTHQIRVQFSYRKMSLLGDKKYGARDDLKDVALLSYRLAFKHPTTQENLIFEIDYNEFINKYFKSAE